MLLIQNKRVNWETCQIGIPGATAKDKENRRIPFNPKGRLAAILERRAELGPRGVRVRRRPAEYQPNIQTAWETLRLLAHGIEPKPGREGARGIVSSSSASISAGTTCGTKARAGSLADGVDIRIIQLMLGHASIQQTQRYLNVTDEELRRGLEVSWNNKGRPLRLASGVWATADRKSPRFACRPNCHTALSPGTGNLVAGAGFEPATFGL